MGHTLTWKFLFIWCSNLAFYLLNLTIIKMNEILCMIKNHSVNTLETNLISVDKDFIFIF